MIGVWETVVSTAEADVQLYHQTHLPENGFLLGIHCSDINT